MRKLKSLLCLALVIINVTGCSNNSSSVKQTQSNLGQVQNQTDKSTSETLNATKSSVQSQGYNRKFWHSKDILNIQVKGVKEGKLTVSIPEYVKIPHYNYIDGYWKIFDLEINQQTLIWQDGQLIPYAQSAKLNQKDFACVLVQEQGNRIIAKEVYGPIIQIWGKVKKVTGNQLTVQELKYTETPDSLNYPTGRTIYMQYDARTAFDSSCSPESLKPGVVIQSTAVGRFPGKLLIQGLSVYNGPTN